MENKDVKKLLKEAKGAIKEKDFKTALKLSKAILKEDRNNYTGLVLLGRALQESDQKDQAPNAFRKAAELQPGQPLAWQGLASYFEKIGGPAVEEDLLIIYENLIPLETNLERRQEITDRLADIAFRKQKPSFCTNVFKKLKDIPDDARGVRRSLLKSLLQFKELPEEDLNELEPNIEQFLSEWKALGSPSDPDAGGCYRRFLKLLYRRKDFKRLIQEAIRMVEFFPTDLYPREWLCKVYSELHIEGNVLSREDLAGVDAVILTHVDYLFKSNANSKVAMVAQAVYHYLSGQTVPARDELLWASVIPPQSWHLWLLLSELQLILGLPSEAAVSAAEATTILAKLKDNVSAHVKRAMLIEASARSQLCKEEDLTKAVKLSEEILKEDCKNETAIAALARAYLNRKDISEAEFWVAQLDLEGPNWETAIVLQAKCNIAAGKTSSGEDLLERNKENATSLLWLELARRRILKGNNAEIIAALREAAKRGPLNFDVFRLLGDYYSGKSSVTAVEKARRCYQEAFRINPWSDEVGEKLSDTLRLLNDTDGNRQFLESVTRSGDCCWAWLRLGLLYADEGNTDSSVICLCKAISKDPANSRSWESLADAYCLRGSWTSALKCYEHVVELEPTSLYSKYRIAFVKFTLGLYEEALTEFRTLTTSAPHFVPALHGLGETCLSGAKQLFSEHRLGCCLDRCQEAVNALCRASAYRRLSCVWKLLGDTCLLVSQLPIPLNHLIVPQSIVRLSEDPAEADQMSQRTEKLEGVRLFELAARLYCRAMPANLENSLLWHDVALTYQRHAAAVSDKAYLRSLRQQALNAARRAINIAPLNAEHWNLLGVIAASEGLQQYALAQHAFIRAVKLDLNYATAWTNLGAVYFIVGYPEFANRMFAVGMRAEPEYTNSWVGQALVAEHLKMKEVLGLFRHASSLPFHREAAKGYAQQILQMVQHPKRNDKDYRFAIERMHAVPVATDCMQWYTGLVKNDACAWNMFGLLLERMGLLRRAESAYRSALQELDENNSENKRDFVVTNLGRVLIAKGKYSEAVELLQKIRKATFASQCTLALALYKTGQHRESYSAYETSLHWMAGDDGLKSHILVAMAALMYTLQRVDDAKTLLFTSVELKPVSVRALLATCALGILHQDLTLTLSALRELKPHRDDPEFLHHIAIFHAYSYFFKGDVKGSLRNLCSAIHRHPCNAALWLNLAQLQFELADRDEYCVLAAGHTAYAALIHGRSTMDVSKVLSLVTLAELVAGNGQKSLIRAQQGVHQSPDVAENWVVLVGALLSKSGQKLSWLRQLITHVRRRLESTSPSLNVWLSKNERIVDSKLAA